MKVEEIWPHAQMLMTLSQSEMLDGIDEAIRASERAEAIGPLFNPSAWLGRDAFKTHKLLQDALALVRDFRNGVRKLEADRAEYVATQE